MKSIEISHCHIKTAVTISQGASAIWLDINLMGISQWYHQCTQCHFVAIENTRSLRAEQHSGSHPYWCQMFWLQVPGGFTNGLLLCTIGEVSGESSGTIRKVPDTLMIEHHSLMTCCHTNTMSGLNQQLNIININLSNIEN